MESILVIDDDFAVCSVLREYFTSQKIHLAISQDWMKGFNAARSGAFDLVLLDIMLAGADGLESLRRLCSESDVRVLVLTSRGDVDDRILGLDCGADDYLPKPFDPRELVARIRALLRRGKRSRAQSAPGEREISIGDFALDAVTRNAQYCGKTLALTGAEFALLKALLESPGVVVPREQLFRRISRRPFHPLDRSLDMQVSRLRRKLVIEGNRDVPIRAIRNAGYVFASPNCLWGTSPKFHSH